MSSVGLQIKRDHIKKVSVVQLVIKVFEGSDIKNIKGNKMRLSYAPVY